MNEISKQAEPEFTPSWSAVLDALVDINSPVVTPPAVSLENSWEYVIVRLLKIHQEQDCTDGWVVYQLLEAGNPPIEYWIWLSEKLGYSAGWGATMRGKRSETASPDINKIGFEYWEGESNCYQGLGTIRKGRWSLCGRREETSGIAAWAGVGKAKLSGAKNLITCSNNNNYEYQALRNRGKTHESGRPINR